MGRRIILTTLIAILLFSSMAFALDLSSDVYKSGDTVYFSGTIPRYDDCSNSRVDVRTLLYDPVFGYLKLGNETYERNEDGSFDVEGSYDLSEYANGKYNLVENIAYLCFDSSLWKTYGDFMGDRIYENEFIVTDPIFDNITKYQAGTYGKVYEFDLKEIADIDLLLAYDWHIKCKVNDELVINNDIYDAVMENSWDGEEGYHIKIINITDNLKIGKNKIECGSHQRVVGPYSGPYCPPPQDGRWCIHQEHYPGISGSCSCCYQCFNAPGADFDIAVRRRNPNLATWTLGKDDYMYELPIREDKWYSRTAEFYVVDETSDTFSVRNGAIPWSENEQTIYWNTNLDNITDKWIYISTPTEASCNINGASFTLSESFYNDDEYWIWKVPSNYLEQGINDFECTVPKSEEYLNFFDIKIASEPIFEPSNIVGMFPLEFLEGEQDHSDLESNGTSSPTIPTTEAALGVVALTAAAGLGAYTMGSKRASYFAWLKGEKQKYNEHLAGIEARNQEIRGWIPQVKEKVEAHRRQLYEEYMEKFRNARSHAEQTAILNLMSGDNNLGSALKSKANGLKEYISKEINNVKSDAKKDFNNFRTIASAPKELMTYYDVPADYSDPRVNLVTGAAAVNGSWWDQQRIYGQDGNLTLDEYNALLEEEATIVKLENLTLSNRKKYELGIFLSKEGLRWEDSGDGFSRVGQITLLGIVTIPLSKISSKLASTCYLLGALHKLFGNIIQKDVVIELIEYQADKETLRKFEREINENLIDAGIMGLITRIDNIKHPIAETLGTLSTLFYKEVDRIVNWVKVNPVGAKEDIDK